MASVVSFAQLPDEEPAFLAYLEETGDIWARAVNDDPYNPKYEPMPVSEFLNRFSHQIGAYDCVDVFLATRDDIMKPSTCFNEMIEGGTVVWGPTTGVGTIVGGQKVVRESIDPFGSPFVRYLRGQFRSSNELAGSALCFYSGRFEGTEWRPNSPEFMKWGKRILAWMRRHTPELVPVYEANYEMRATAAVAAAVRRGLKVR